MNQDLICLFKRHLEQYGIMRDWIVDEVRHDLRQRSQKGIDKYGTTLDRTDLSLRDWLQHAYEESLDKSLYLKRAIKELDEGHRK